MAVDLSPWPALSAQIYYVALVFALLEFDDEEEEAAEVRFLCFLLHQVC